MQIIIDLADIDHTQGCIVFIDQEKAFDRVNRTFLRKCLEKIGLSKQSLDIIMTLYEDARSIPYINGEPVEDIKCEKGTRQGDPLSGIIYICIMEAMAQSPARSRYTGPRPPTPMGRRSGEFRDRDRPRNLSIEFNKDLY